jgi:NAD-dependent dihydropyrimidine dehydrogenase PreA subunit
MIEIVDDGRCTRCNLCVRVCPMDVFDLVEDGPPVIARQDSCQTCFMCEAHCPVDALYVAPLKAPAPVGSPHLDFGQLAADGVIGSFRARLGWGDGRTPPRTTEALFALAGLPVPSETPAIG